jgi:hypothetical protein
VSVVDQPEFRTVQERLLGLLERDGLEESAAA